MARSAAPLVPLALLALVAAAWALTVGAMAIPFEHVADALLRPLGLGALAPADPQERAAILQIRLPRVLLALLAGAALAQAGAAMQAIFRNPLAEPAVIGVAGGAAVAAVALIVLGEAAGVFDHVPARWLVPGATFAGGLLATALVARLAQVDGYTRPATLLLAGLALNAIAGAAIDFLSHVAGDAALRNLTFWMFGSLGRAGWAEIAVGAPLLAIALLLIPRDARALDALQLGEAEAGHLGVDVERLKRRLTLLTVLAAGTAVALAGIIAFVGLVVPHLVRLWVGPGHRALLPAAALLGAALLVLADTAARTLLAPAELPIGVLTALVGGPFFLALLVRYRRETDFG